MNERFGFNETPAVDARDYFKLTAFQKKAASLDVDHAHSWKSVYDYFIAENESGSFVMGTYVGDDDSRRLLLANRTGDGAITSAGLENLTPLQLGEITDALSAIIPNLPDTTRQTFVNMVIQDLASTKPEGLVADKLARRMLELLSDTDSGKIPAEEIYDSPLIKSLAPEKQKPFADFLLQVSRKITADVFKSQFQEFSDSLKFRDDPFGKSYPFLYLEVARWVLDNRTDTKRDYQLLQQPELPKYYVTDMIERPITSKEELFAILSSMPVETMPDIRNRKVNSVQAEMVELENLIGGATISSWSVSTSEGRGLERIFQLVQDFQNNQRDVVGADDPITAYKIDNKYYINSDGRHRTAALKALGVKEVPMLVSVVE